MVYSCRLAILIEKTYFFLVVLVGMSIPLSIRLNSYLLVITFSLSVIHYAGATNKQVRGRKHLLMFATLFFLHFLAFLNSENLRPVLFDLEQKLTLLALPLIFAMGPALDFRKRAIILFSFATSVFIVSLLSFRNGFYMGFAGEELFSNLLVHRPYLGMYCVFCFFICTELLLSKNNQIISWTCIALIGFFFLYLIVLFAKMAILTLTALILFYLLWKLYFLRKYKMVAATAIIILSGLAYFSLIHSQGRIIAKKVLSFSTFNWQEYDPLLVNSVNLRFIKWSCSAEILANDHNWLSGAGTGDIKLLLNSCYAERLGQDSFFVAKSYNSHNNYLTVWLHLGLLGFLFYLFHFAVVLRIYLVRKEIIGLIFTLCVMILSLTESVWEVQKGLVFYSYFQSLFLFTKNRHINLTR